MIPCTLSGSAESSIAPRSRRSARVLLRVERVAARAGEHRRLRLGGQHRPLEQRVDELRRLLVRERRERDRRRVRLPAAPARPRVSSSGRAVRDDEDRDAAGPVDEVVDEVEQAVVGPLEVLETSTSGRWSASASRSCRHAANASARRSLAGSCSGREADERAARATRPTRLVRRRAAATVACELLARLLGVVRLEDAGLRLDHLAERPEADAFAVGQASAPAAR